MLRILENFDILSELFKYLEDDSRRVLRGLHLNANMVYLRYWLTIDPAQLSLYRSRKRAYYPKKFIARTCRHLCFRGSLCRFETRLLHGLELCGVVKLQFDAVEMCPLDLYTICEKFTNLQWLQVEYTVTYKTIHFSGKPYIGMLTGTNSQKYSLSRLCLKYDSCLIALILRCTMLNHLALYRIHDCDFNFMLHSHHLLPTDTIHAKLQTPHSFVIDVHAVLGQDIQIISPLMDVYCKNDKIYIKQSEYLKRAKTLEELFVRSSNYNVLCDDHDEPNDDNDYIEWHSGAMFPCLSKLTFYSVNVADIFFVSILNIHCLPQLRELYIYNCQLMENFLVSLQQHTHIEKLTFSSVTIREQEHNDVSSSSLPVLPNIKQLFLWNSDANLLKYYRTFTHVHSIQICNSRMAMHIREIVAHLVSFTSVQRVNFTDCNFSLLDYTSMLDLKVLLRSVRVYMVNPYNFQRCEYLFQEEIQQRRLVITRCDSHNRTLRYMNCILNKNNPLLEH